MATTVDAKPSQAASLFLILNHSSQHVDSNPGQKEAGSITQEEKERIPIGKGVGYEKNLNHKNFSFVVALRISSLLVMRFTIKP